MISRHLSGFLCKHGRIPKKGALERSSSTNLREVNPRNKHVVVTLDPNKFAEKKQKRFLFGNRKTLRSSVMLHNQSSYLNVLPFRYDTDVDSGIRRYLTYPPDTKAFLYYYTLRERPRIAGELRFRVTSSDDPASFESGFDLLKSNGQIWSRPLFILSKWYTPLYEKLREEQLVPDDLHRLLSTFPDGFCKYRRTQFLYSLNDTFIIDFSHHMRNLIVLTEQGMAKLHFLASFIDKRAKYKSKPYTGSALVRLERSTLPHHKGTRTVVLRFIKIITPVKYMIPLYDGNILPPKEGELHRRVGRKPGPDQLVWSVNIDKENLMKRALQLLWDT